MEEWIENVPMPPRVSTKRLVQIYSLIKEKNDARAVVAFATLFIVAAGPIVTSLGSIAAIVLSVVSLASSVTPSVWLWVLVIALSIATLISTAVAVLSQRHIERTVGNQRWLTDFQPLQIVSQCLVHDQFNITYRYRFVLRARRPMREFQFRFTWSGVGDIEIRLRDKRHTFEAPVPLPIGNQRRLMINLGREVGKRQVEVVEFDLVTRAAQPAQPFTAMPITSKNHPRFNAHLVVAFGPNAPIARVFRETTLLGTSSYEDSPAEPEPIPADRIVAWRVPVRFGLRYVLRWEYT